MCERNVNQHSIFDFRWVYWTDWGIESKLERATLGGDGRATLLSRGIIRPTGVTIDYATHRWVTMKTYYNSGVFLLFGTW